MFHPIPQLAGLGNAHSIPKPENPGGNASAPDNAVFGRFGDLLHQAVADKQHAGEPPAAKQAADQTQGQNPQAPTLPNADAQTPDADTGKQALTAQSPQDPTPATTDTDTKTDSDNASPKLSQEIPMGQLAGADTAHAASADVSDPVQAKGTDASGLTDFATDNNHPLPGLAAPHHHAPVPQPAQQPLLPNETASSDETLPVDAHAQQSDTQSGAQGDKTDHPEDGNKAADTTLPAAVVYNPVFETPGAYLFHGHTLNHNYADKPATPAIALPLQNAQQPSPKPVLPGQPQQADTNNAQQPPQDHHAAFVLPSQPSQSTPVQTSVLETTSPTPVYVAAGGAYPVSSFRNAGRNGGDNRGAGVQSVNNAPSGNTPATTSAIDGNSHATVFTAQNATDDHGFGDTLGSATGQPDDHTTDDVTSPGGTPALHSLLSAHGAQLESVAATTAQTVSTASPQTTTAAGLPVFHPTAQSVADQVVEATQYGVKDGQKELVIKLNPDNLGDVRLHLTSNLQQEVSARLIVSNPDTQNLLHDQIQSLRQSLEAQGINVDKLTVVMAGHSDLGAGTQQQFSHDGGNSNAFWANSNGNQPGTSQQQSSNGQSQHQSAFFQQMTQSGSGGHFGGHAHQSQAFYNTTGNTSGQAGSAQQGDTTAIGGTLPDSTPSQALNENGRVSLLV